VRSNSVRTHNCPIQFAASSAPNQVEPFTSRAISPDRRAIHPSGKSRNF
jgi:hypothetical protein